MPVYRLTVNRGPILAEFHASDDKAAAEQASSEVAKHKLDEHGSAEYQLYRQAVGDSWDFFWGRSAMREAE